jgi:hypothetical protein
MFIHVRSHNMALGRSPDLTPVSGPDQVEDRPGSDQQAQTDGQLGRGLAGYLAAVASSLDVSVEATASEVTDTATAYLALAARTPEHPGRDLMLVWNERHGWRLAVETNPGEDAVVLAYLGADPVPEPAVVARFVHDVLAGAPAGATTAPWDDADADRDALGDRLARYTEA